MTDTNMVEYVESDTGTVAIVDDDAYKLSSETDVVLHEAEDSESILLITQDEVYVSEYDSDGWLIAPEGAPEYVMDFLDDQSIRYAEADVYGYPIEFTVGFGSSPHTIYETAWQKEHMRPSSKVMDQIESSIQTVQLTIQVDSEANIQITDVSVFPDKSSVTFDL